MSYDFNFTMKEVNLVLKALGNLPYVESAETVQKIIQSAQKQRDEASEDPAED